MVLHVAGCELHEKIIIECLCVMYSDSLHHFCLKGILEDKSKSKLEIQPIIIADRLPTIICCNSLL